MSTKPTCAHCRKPIKGPSILTNPPLFEIRLGLAEEPKYFHPACYLRADHGRTAEHYGEPQA